MPQKLNELITVGPGERVILLEDIKDMIRYYREDDAHRKTPVDKVDDANSCWISIQEVFALIADNPGATGIRIYYGRHRQSTLSETQHNEYKDRHNVILVTTEDTVDQLNPTAENSSDLLNAEEGNGRPVNAVSYTGKGADNIPSCPPSCPPGSGHIL